MNGAPSAIVTFHRSELDALDGINTVAINYTNQVAYTQETLWARLEDTTDNCFDLTSFTFKQRR